MGRNSSSHFLCVCTRREMGCGWKRGLVSLIDLFVHWASFSGSVTASSDCFSYLFSIQPVLNALGTLYSCPLLWMLPPKLASGSHSDPPNSRVGWLVVLEDCAYFHVRNAQESLLREIFHRLAGSVGASAPSHLWVCAWGQLALHLSSSPWSWGTFVPSGSTIIFYRLGLIN